MNNLNYKYIVFYDPYTISADAPFGYADVNSVYDIVGIFKTEKSAKDFITENGNSSHLSIKKIYWEE